MKTKLLADCAADLLDAAKLLREGQVVGIPTETVYGLAADACNEEAIQQIFSAKGRPADNPLIVHIAKTQQLAEIAASVPSLAQKLANAFWPGPLTMILPKHHQIPTITSGGLDTVGVRMPSHPAARALILLSGVPLAAPSANRSGYPSPTTAAHVMNDMQGKIAAVLDGGTCNVGVESTVIAFENEDTVRILRPGYVTEAMLRNVVPNVILDPAILQQLPQGQIVRSPGMKYQHYAPRAHVTLVKGSQEAFHSFVRQHVATDVYVLVFDEQDKIPDVSCLVYGATGEEQAQLVFSKLRELDDLGAKQVFVHAPNPNGVGLAVYNRLIRAAGFEVIQV
ncbi:MAG: threonylcarbamoyl-AMP synthase [Ruminococcus sp.]|nr:threonylcarbamoyl-AMP synthase [Ruminococcus sp.]